MMTPEVYHLIELALVEDQSFNDITTASLIPSNLIGQGQLRSKDTGILAGIDVALAVFERVDSQLAISKMVNDGDRIGKGECIAKICGPVVGLLRGERPALNFLQRMSGIATDTSKYVEAVEGYKAKIFDTRKTVPGWRYLDKYSVRMGGGFNHRVSLLDGILIKDNHIDLLRRSGLTLYDIVRRAVEFGPKNEKVEIEVTSLSELREAVEAGADIIMLDNMSIEDMRIAAELVNGRSILEASGGIDIDSVVITASTGVDIISIGRLTHSVAALDINLDIEFD